MYSPYLAAARAIRRRRLARLAWAGLAIALAVGLLAGLTWLAAGSPRPPGPARPDLLPSSASEIERARAELEGLREAAGPDAGEYRRSAFGDAWTDTDGNGCNQRDDVLLRDVDRSLPFRVQQQRRCDHDVLAGTWVDPYSGAVITLTDAKQPDQAQAVQIDHVVALSVAWRSGAGQWPAAQRLRFANDLQNLLAVGGAANQAKGGSDPASWQPIAAARCGYAVRYVHVKSTYSLSVEAAEQRALARMLDTCPR